MTYRVCQIPGTRTLKLNYASDKNISSLRIKQEIWEPLEQEFISSWDHLGHLPKDCCCVEIWQDSGRYVTSWYIQRERSLVPEGAGRRWLGGCKGVGNSG